MAHPLPEEMPIRGVLASGEFSEICGFHLLALGYTDAVSYILGLLAYGKGAWVLTLNLEILSTARLDPDYRRLVESSDIVFADGAPFVWASRVKRGVKMIPQRVTGSDISADLITRFPASKIAIIGGVNPPQALQELQIERSHDVFVFDGKIVMRRDWVDDLADQIERHGAQLIFVALGVPKQDFVAKALREKMPHAVIIGVGGTFELIAGLKPRAPKWMQTSGLEWLFRLYVEPRRLWRRYLVLYWVGLINLIGDVVGLGPKKSPPDQVSAPN